MLKIKKRKMHFWTPKRRFYTKLMKKTLFNSKSLPLKVSSEYRKNVQGEKLEPPQKPEFHDFGPPKPFPLNVYLSSEDTF